VSALRELVEGAAWEEVLHGAVGDRIAPLLRRTPLLSSPALAEAVGASEAYLKAESLQRTGSFKLRGALARLAALAPDQAPRGVVTASAGNHGLGIAQAAALLGLGATVLVPPTSPEVKRRGIEALGAEILVVGGGYDEAERIARGIAEERGTPFVSGFDDEHVIAGNGGTSGREIREDLGGMGPNDLVVVPVGGGGLISGVLGALHGTRAEIVGVEPETNRAMHRSLELGVAQIDYPEGEPTLAEGLEGGVSERTFAIVREALAGLVLVPEEGILRAMRWAYWRGGLILEPSAATALAAVLEGKIGGPGRRVVCLLTGSNVDPDLLDRALAGGPG
jgi:threonine dehydratase